MGTIAEKQRQIISVADFVILQFFYAFETVCTTVTSVFKWSFWQKPQAPTTAELPNTPSNEKRHFIQLYKTEPTKVGEKPVCYMNVIEFDNSHQEEEIRKSRRRSYDFTNNQNFVRHYQRHQRTRSNQELQRFYCSNLRY